MRSRWWKSLAALLAASGTALAQSAAPPPAGAVHAAAATSAQSWSTDSPAHGGPVLAPDSTPTTAESFANDPLIEPAGNPANPPIGNSEFSNYRVWVGAAYMLWHLPSEQVPNVTSVNSVPIQADALTNALGGPAIFAFQNTTVLPGAPGLSNSDHSGLRVEAGIWMDPGQEWGVQGNYFMLERRSSGSNALQETDLNVNTPFFTLFSVVDPNSGAPTTTVLPSTLPGTLVVDLHARNSSSLWGSEANLLCRKCYFGTVSVDFLGGFRYLDLKKT